MPLNIDVQYTNLLGHRLERFSIVRQQPFVAKCRCPLCGDSKTDPRKTRGYFFEMKGEIRYKCHKCGEGGSIGRILSVLNKPLFDDYRLDTLKNSGSLMGGKTTVREAQYKLEANTFKSDMSKFAKRKHEKDERFDPLVKLSSLPVGHPCRKYVESRKIDPKLHHLLFYIPKFKEFTNTLMPAKFDEKSLQRDSARLIIPLFTPDGRIFAYQGRSLDPNDKIRYITIVLDDSVPRIYGLERIDKKQPIRVLEGPIDSLFVNNAVAQAGGDNGDIWRIAEPSELVFVFDNEPRNEDTVRRMQKVVERGAKVVVWPDSIKSKDVNDMILKEGMTVEQIERIIDKNTYAGLAATLAIQYWNKV
jgi:hypothetical protein